MAKNKKRQPFTMFVHDWKKREEKRGRVFPGGFPEAIKMAGPFWEALPPEKKARYKEEANAYNEWQKKNPHLANKGKNDPPAKPQIPYRPPVSNELQHIHEYVHSKSIGNIILDNFHTQ